MNLEQLNQSRMDPYLCTLYDQTQLNYSYMEYLLEHYEEMGLDLSKFKDEIESFQKKCAVWVSLYEEAIYPQFARLLDALMVQILVQSDKRTYEVVGSSTSQKIEWIKNH
jgi:UDP-N-acetylglucosamine enolpyruvyl transferase